MTDQFAFGTQRRQGIGADVDEVLNDAVRLVDHDLGVGQVDQGAGVARDVVGLAQGHAGQGAGDIDLLAERPEVEGHGRAVAGQRRRHRRGQGRRRGRSRRGGGRRSRSGGRSRRGGRLCERRSGRERQRSGGGEQHRDPMVHSFPLLC
jgi:hypothetical protein